MTYIASISLKPQSVAETQQPQPTLWAWVNTFFRAIKDYVIVQGPSFVTLESSTSVLWIFVVIEYLSWSHPNQTLLAISKHSVCGKVESWAQACHSALLGVSGRLIACSSGTPVYSSLEYRGNNHPTNKRGSSATSSWPLAVGQPGQRSREQRTASPCRLRDGLHHLPAVCCSEVTVLWTELPQKVSGWVLRLQRWMLYREVSSPCLWIAVALTLCECFQQKGNSVLLVVPPCSLALSLSIQGLVYF